jgi:hypothetical protein
MPTTKAHPVGIFITCLGVLSLVRPASNGTAKDPDEGQKPEHQFGFLDECVHVPAALSAAILRSIFASRDLRSRSKAEPGSIVATGSMVWICLPNSVMRARVMA